MNKIKLKNGENSFTLKSIKKSHIKFHKNFNKSIKAQIDIEFIGNENAF
jgi:hypothetical protein